MKKIILLLAGLSFISAKTPKNIKKLKIKPNKKPTGSIIGGLALVMSMTLILAIPGAGIAGVIVQFDRKKIISNSEKWIKNSPDVSPEVQKLIRDYGKHRPILASKETIDKNNETFLEEIIKMDHISFTNDQGMHVRRKSSLVERIKNIAEERRNDPDRSHQADKIIQAAKELKDIKSFEQVNLWLGKLANCGISPSKLFQISI